MKKSSKKFFKKFKKNKFKFNKRDFFSNSKFSLVEVVLLLFITLVVGVLIGYFITFDNNKLDDNVDFSLVSVVYDRIVNDYYKEVSPEEIDKAAINGIIDYLNDENTIELSDSLYADLNEQVKGYFCGIGVSVIYEDGNLVVVKVIEGSVSDKAGIEIDDIITEVDGVLVTQDNYLELIKGKCDTKFKLKVKRNNEELDLDMTREPVIIETVQSQYFDVNDKFVGYIDLDVFANNSYDLFVEHLERLEKQNISSLIIDLRGNPGGVVNSAGRIMNLFFEKNTTLYSYKSKKKLTIIKDNTKEYRDYPIVILIDGETASAAEMFASAFKENYKDIKLVGTTTYGKNTIQTNLTLTDDYGIKYTSSEWLSSKDVSVKGTGVSPDVVVINGGSDFYDDYPLQEAIDLLKK